MDAGSFRYQLTDEMQVLSDINLQMDASSFRCQLTGAKSPQFGSKLSC
jgi:hypothetical protein